MTTSGVTDWSMTAGEIVTQAMIELGLINSGEEPDANEMSDAIVRLNAMMKTWAGELNLWREATGTITITGGTGAATLDADIRNVSSVRHVVSATNYRTLTQWNRDQFYMMPNRATVGNPTLFYITRALGGDAIHIWPVPAADVTLHLDYSRAAETVTDPSETVDLPQEWQEAAILSLASRISGMFGSTTIDPATVGRIDQRASELYNRMVDRDRPDSYTFEPYSYG